MKLEKSFAVVVASISVWGNGSIDIYDGGCGCCAGGGKVSKEQAIKAIDEQIESLEQFKKVLRILPSIEEIE